jgi:hypothetical protein
LAGDRQDTRKKQLLDHKRNKLPSNGSKSRDNPLSAVRGTTRRLFVLGGKIALHYISFYIQPKTLGRHLRLSSPF